MKAGLALVLLSVTLVQVAPVHASEPEASRTTERQATLAGRGAWAGFVTASTGRNGWNVVNFYVIQDQSRREPIAYARLAHGNLTGLTRVEWADGRTCPALKPAMLAIKDLRAPAIEVPSFERRTGPVRVPKLVLDGVTYDVWGQGRFSPDDASIDVEISSNDPDSSLARWVEMTLKATASCWSPVEPQPY